MNDYISEELKRRESMETSDDAEVLFFIYLFSGHSNGVLKWKSFQIDVGDPRISCLTHAEKTKTTFKESKSNEERRERMPG